MATIRCLGGSCDAPSYRAPSLQQTQACSIIDTFVEEEQFVGTMAARYKVLGTDTKATSEGSEGLVVPAWDQEDLMIVALKRQDRKSDEAPRELMFFNAIPHHPHVVSIIETFV